MARQRRAEFIKGAVDARTMPDGGRAEIAFLGRSNVGKSSLVNLLLGRRELARISNKPGKTRELNYYLIDDRYYLVDLPGYGYAKVSKVERARWARVLTAYLLEREPLRLVVHLIDSRHEPTKLDEQAMDVMAQSEAGYVVVLTKSDKPKQRDLAQNLRATRRVLEDRGLDVPVIATSARAKRGDRELWRVIEKALATPRPETPQPETPQTPDPEVVTPSPEPQVYAVPRRVRPSDIEPESDLESMYVDMMDDEEEKT